jgi:lipoyl(octanoyl) transferase
MQAYTDQRNEQTPDELWLVEHPPVFTLGQAGSTEHVLAPGDIPIIHVDRGGQVTYHGPGQVVAYPLIDLKRAGLGIRALVALLEEAVIKTLAAYQIDGQRREGAPGVYVDGRKVASLGLRVRRSCTFHGLAFNVNMDLSPFQRINPCGYQGLEVTQVVDLGGPADWRQVANDLVTNISELLGLESVAGDPDLPKSTPAHRPSSESGPS